MYFHVQVKNAQLREVVETPYAYFGQHSNAACRNINEHSEIGYMPLSKICTLFHPSHTPQLFN
jgi:hypothetical protein